MPLCIGVAARLNSRSNRVESTTNGAVNSYIISTLARASGMNSPASRRTPYVLYVGKRVRHQGRAADLGLLSGDQVAEDHVAERRAHYSGAVVVAGAQGGRAHFTA